MNGVYLHHELIEVISDQFISTVVYASVSLLNLTVLGPNINDDIILFQ